jgi:NAD(P)-dependent dehydrogenase (short-subunit alcohol dehydrogenase family)
MTDLFDLTGRIAAIAFAQHGADVVIASRKVDACESLAAEIAASTGRRTAGIACHVGKWDDCQRLFDEVNARFGGAQILVNNAGMSPLYRSLGEIGEDLYDKVLDVNLKGAFRLSVLFGEHMAAHEGGSIINVSSIAAVTPSPAEVPYAMAKAAMNTMTVALARTLAPKVRVNCIMPGSFLTDISTAWDMEAFEKSAKTMIPLGRGGQPREIVGAALYLASDASSYTTGSILKVDGGATRSVGGG